MFVLALSAQNGVDFYNIANFIMNHNLVAKIWLCFGVITYEDATFQVFAANSSENYIESEEKNIFFILCYLNNKKSMALQILNYRFD